MYVCVRTYAENFCVKCNGSMTSKNGESESDKVKPGTIIDPFGESYLITPWNRSVARYVRTVTFKMWICQLFLQFYVLNDAEINIGSFHHWVLYESRGGNYL